MEKPRNVAVMEGTGMGGVLTIYKTNAPETQPDLNLQKLLLSFKVGDEQYDFWGKDLEVEIETYGRINVYADDLTMYHNGYIVEDKYIGESFTGKISQFDAFEEAVFMYLRMDQTYSWEYVCDYLNSLATEGLFSEIVRVKGYPHEYYPKHTVAWNQIVDLAWVGKTSLYYIKDESGILVDPVTMRAQTSMENFVTEGLIQMLEDPNECITEIEKDADIKSFAKNFDIEVKSKVHYAV